MFLGIEQKRADPDNLDGRLIVYARIDIEPSDLINLKHPIASVIHNGLLVAQNNYREQTSLRDFLKSELGLSLEEGLEEIIDRMDGLESALDPQKLREKIDGMKEFEEFIPTPAKIVPFNSEEEILEQEGDIFYVGSFENIGNANLCVNSFPILYQARYREQQIGKVRSEIEFLIGQIETGESPPSSTVMPPHELKQRILRDFIPDLLYHRQNAHEFETAQAQFREFMAGYHQPQEVEALVELISKAGELSSSHYRLIELLASKIEAAYAQRSNEVEQLDRQIDHLREEMGKSAG